MKTNTKQACMDRKQKDPAAVALGRKGGKVSTDATREAARKNGLKGGLNNKTKRARELKISENKS